MQVQKYVQVKIQMQVQSAGEYVGASLVKVEAKG
jgi:hypothetical protein